MTPTPPPLTPDEIEALRKLHEEDASAGAAFDADEGNTANMHRLLATTEALRNALHNAAPQLLAACERVASLETRVKELGAENERLRSGSLLRAPVVVPRIDTTTEEGRAALARGAAVARSLRAWAWLGVERGDKRYRVAHYVLHSQLEAERSKVADLEKDAAELERESLGLRADLLRENGLLHRAWEGLEAAKLETQSAYDHGFKEGFSCDLGAGDDTRAKLKAAEAKLRAAEAVVERCLKKQEGNYPKCALCGFDLCRGGAGHYRPHHDADCPLVTNGFVTVEGKRIDDSRDGAGGSAKL